MGWYQRRVHGIVRLLNYIILLIPILVNVAFITLLERKILGYSQLRKGPNKVSIIGIAQPFNDAIKLFTKEIVYPKLSNIFQYLISPFCAPRGPHGARCRRCGARSSPCRPSW